MPFPLDETEIARHLTTLRMGRVLRLLSVTGSTNADALDWAEEGAPDGALVAAEHQTAGRGRFDRVWESPAGENLTFSVVLLPPLGRERYGLIGLAAAVAVCATVEPLLPGAAVRIKWPNDILVEGRKCCGILPETRMVPGLRHPPAVLGIGLNVNQSGFSDSVGPRATSLCIESGVAMDRNGLLAALLGELESVIDVLWSGDFRTVRARYVDRMEGLHEETLLHLARDGSPIVGRLAGVDEFGALRLHVGREERTFHAGELTFRRRP